MGHAALEQEQRRCLAAAFKRLFGVLHKKPALAARFGVMAVGAVPADAASLGFEPD